MRFSSSLTLTLDSDRGRSHHTTPHSPSPLRPAAFAYKQRVLPNLVRFVFLTVVFPLLAHSTSAQSIDIKKSPIYQRVRAYLDAVPAIDTHDHLKPPETLQGQVQTDRGTGMNLASLWSSSYYTWINPLTSWPKSGKFEDWWPKAKKDFDNARATSFYRYQLPAFTDLYGVDFETISDSDALRLNDAIFQNYQSTQWIHKVVTERANIELMFIDPYWDRLGFQAHYSFGVPVLNVTSLLRGFHKTEFLPQLDNIYYFAMMEKLEIRSIDDYLEVIDHLFEKAKAAGAVCLKTTVAYQRTLDFQKVSKETAAKAFGKTRGNSSPEEIKAFEDFILWRLVELSAKHELPFQIHTGQARIQGSNPMLLVDLIEANPKTKFILFHGGFPWIGETGVIVMRYPKQVWVDSVWLPTLSYTMAKRAFLEWLEVMPSDRILWGADAHHVEGIYAATEVTRRCLAEALSEKIERGELREDHALRIGRQVLRDNALALFPQLNERLWKP